MNAKESMMNHDAHALALARPLPPAAPLATPPRPADPLPVYDVLGVLARRWRFIAGTVAITVAATAAYCLLATRWYEGRTTLLIDARSPQLINGQRVGDEPDAFTSAKYDYYQTQFTLLQNPAIAAHVIDDLHLGDNPSFLPRGTAPGELPPWKLVEEYVNDLDIEPVRGTRLVDVIVSSRDPALAAQMANAHAHAFLRTGLARYDQATEQVRSFLQTKLADLRSRMEEAEVRLTRYQTAHNLLPTQLTQDVSQERFTDLSRRLTAAQADRIGLEMDHQMIAAGQADRLADVLGNPLIQRLRGDLNRLEVDYALMAQRFRPAYPPLQQLDAQLGSARHLLDAEVRKVAEAIETRYAASRQTVRELKRRVSAERRTLLSRRDTESELLRLTGDVETTRALHDNVLARVKELDVAGGADASNMSIVQAAMVPGIPSRPATVFDLALGLVTGLVFGGGIAFLRDSVQKTVRDPNDLHCATGLDTLAIVPDFDAPPPTGTERLRWWAGRGLRRIAPLRHAAPRTRLPAGPGPQAEAYRTLRTSLVVRPVGDPRIILVSSAAAREGKTTTAVNTAVALARCGARVLLVDGDLRLPRCHEAFGASVGPGLGEFLAGTVSTLPLHDTAQERLCLLPAGEAIPDPLEVLSSWRLGSLLDEARNRFDYVIIDSPPVLAVSDGLLFAGAVDGILLVAERDRTTPDRVQIAIDRLRRAGGVLLGTVLNRGHIDSEYYRYGYSPPARRPTHASAAVEVA